MNWRERWAGSSGFTKFVIVWIVPAAGVFITALNNLPTIASAYEAWDAAGMPTIAMRAFVRTEVIPVKSAQSRTDQKLNDMQLDIAMGKRESYDNERAKWQLELSKAQDDSGRSLALQQMLRLDRNNDAINEQIKALRSVRGPQ